MIRKHFIVLFILTYVAILLSCEKDCNEPQTIHRLTQEDYEWQVYFKGDIITYKDSNGNILSDTVVRSEIGLTPPSGGSSEACGKDLESREFIHMEFSGGTEFLVYQIPRGAKTPTIQVENENDLRAVFFVDSTFNQILINGIYYNNVYIGKIDKLWYKTRTVKVYVTKEKGILRFEYDNGEIYERIN